MDWLTNMNNAIIYIEKHLDDTLDLQQAARIAGCPLYYFQKMFTYMTGISLTEYIRRRRMSLAAAELQSSKIKIIDLALKYGYDSPTAFNRAFQKVHGIAPSLIRKATTKITSYPPYHFSLSIQGGTTLNYHVETKKPFRIVGKRCPLSSNLEENFQSIPLEWNHALSDGTLKQLQQLNDQTPYALLGLSIHHTKEWSYLIATASSKETLDFEDHLIPEATWAVFQGSGTNHSLQDLERNVIMNWLPYSGYACADLPDIEVYLKADPLDMIYEYWLPVQSKQEDMI